MPHKKNLPNDIEKSKTKPGFRNIFKWFSKEKTKCRSSTNLELETNENFANGSLFIPLKHSASANNADELISAHGSSSIISGTYSSNYSTFDEQRSNSVISSPSSLRSSSDFAALKSKKRHAPVPPSVRKLNTSFNPFHRSFDSSSLPGENELSKTRSESFIYSKFKRKAPLPPNSFQTELTPKKDKSNHDTCNLSVRPSSTFSNISSFSYSTSSTLQSSTCSEDGTSNFSEKLKCNSLFPVFADKEPMSPRPWYKRKSSKVNNEKKKTFTKGTEKIYDMLMPDIQYSRPNKEVELVFNANSGQFKDINRLSFLSSISDLDRAAVEHIKREKAQKQKARIEHDLTFYKASSTIILNQEHIIPNKQDQAHNSISDTNCSSDSQIAPIVYDNLQFENERNFSNVACNSSNKSNSLLSNVNIDNLQTCNGSFLEFMSHSEQNELQNLGVNYDEYLEEIRREINNDQAPAITVQVNKETPKQRAVFDPELFYQLAKDAKVTCGAKLSKTPSMQSSKKSKQEFISNNNLNKSPVIKRSPKNFGMRMNNFFTPDVSIILEASESVTSSNTTNTPAEDFAPTSTFNIEPSSDLMSVGSDLHSELRINTCDLQEIIESFALDFRRKEGVDNRSEECKETKSKSDRIREEILLLREKDNFLAWQKAMQEVDYSSKTKLSQSTEKKKKWVCDMCTLVNQPWRLHCEACGTLRPPNPRRIDEFQQNIDSHIVENNNELSINLAQDRDRPSVSGQPELKAIRNSNWEKELQSYIQIFDGQANNIKHIDIGSVRNHLFSSRAEKGNDELCCLYNETESQFNDVQSRPNGYHETVLKSDNLIEGNKYEIELHHIRNARLRKFEQLQKSFDLNNSEIRDDRPVCDGPNGQIEDVVIVNQSKEEKCFYKKDFKKSQILKPSGAVKNVVSIFNQLDQFNQTITVEKCPSTKVVKRKHCFASNSFKEFEKLFSNSESFHKEGQGASRCVSPIKADIDITSAINKFDEMAAIAEIEKINKPQPKTTKWKPKFCIGGNSKINLSTNSNEKLLHCNGNENSTNCISNLKQCSSNISPDEANALSKITNDCKLLNQDTCDSVIKDGILYTVGESRKRSMSIGSGTFELFTAKDFANIEAHHSRKASPINDIDAPTLSELSHPLLMPEIRSTNPDRPSFKKLDMEDTPVPTSTKRQDLPEASGFESLKDKLLGNEYELPEDSELVKILMRKIEDARRERRHSEVSSLMEDLAKLKISNYSMERDYSKVTKNENDYQDTEYTRKVNNKSSLSKDSSFKTSSEGSLTPVTSESSSVIHDFITNITEDDFLSLSGAENSLDTESGGESGNVIRRAMKVDPKRREVKSDFTSRLSLQEIKAVVQEGSPFNVKMYVEDKSSHQGPLIVSVYSSMTLENLKTKTSLFLINV